MSIQKHYELCNDVMIHCVYNESFKLVEITITENILVIVIEELEKEDKHKFVFKITGTGISLVVNDVIHKFFYDMYHIKNQLDFQRLITAYWLI